MLHGASSLNCLTYKAKWNERELVRIDRFFPSSKACNHCGYIKQDLKLSDRQWTCNGCGKVNGRDFNAAKNILSEGLKIISAGTVDYRRGDEIRPTSIAGTVRETSKILD
jgi:transposase